MILNYRKIFSACLTAAFLLSGFTTLKAQNVLSCSNAAVAKGDSLTLQVSYPLININLKTDAGKGKYTLEIKNASLVGTSGKNIPDSVRNRNVTVDNLSRLEKSPEPNPWLKPELKIFPNPFNNSTKYACFPVGTQPVKIEVLNVQGRCLFQENITPKTNGWNYGTLRMDKYPSGIYLVRMVQNNFSITQKIFLLK